MPGSRTGATAPRACRRAKQPPLQLPVSSGSPANDAGAESTRGRIARGSRWRRSLVDYRPGLAICALELPHQQARLAAVLLVAAHAADVAVDRPGIPAAQFCFEGAGDEGVAGLTPSFFDLAPRVIKQVGRVTVALPLSVMSRVCWSLLPLRAETPVRPITPFERALQSHAAFHRLPHLVLPAVGEGGELRRGIQVR